MAIGYKSESGAVWLGLAAAIAIPFIPRSAWMVTAPVWAATSRLVARGARCRVRPANEKSGDSTNKKSCEVVMSANMDANERPVAVVTGTNSGIGFHTAVGLAVEGYVVVCTCRSAVLSSQTAEKIRHEAERLQRQNPHKYANTPKPVLVDGQCPIECDDFASVRQFVKWFTQKYGSRYVQVLVNNAGGMRRELRFSIFNPQLEFHTAVNFLGPMLLTELMLPILEKRGGRVVYVASEAHRFPQMVLERRRFWEPLPRCNGVAKGKLSQALRDLNQGKEGSSGPLRNQSLGKAFVRYGTSKLLNTYHAHVVARRYAAEVNPEHRVYACSLHPGCVATNFSRDLIRWNVLNSIYQIVSLLFLKSWEEGAQTTLHCAMCPREELELVYPASAPKDASQAVSPYFVECANKTSAMLLAYGWDVSEAEDIVAWGKGVLQLS